MKPITTHREIPFSRPRRRPNRLLVAVEGLEGRELLSTVATSLSIAVSNPSPFYTEAETVTATITVASDVAIPNRGTVSFFDNGNELGTAAVSQGTASFMTSSLGMGPHVFTATYGGYMSSDGAQYAASIATGTQSVVPASGLTSVAGIAVDSSGDVFIADSVSGDVIKVTPSGTQTIIASGQIGARGLAVDAMGDVFIADTNNDRVVEITNSNQQVVIASGLSSPQGVAVDAQGDVFIANSGANQVLELTHSGKQLTIGSGLSNPESVAVDSAGDVFIADTGHARVVEVPAHAPQETLGDGISTAYGVAVDARGNLFVASGTQVVELTPANTLTTFGTEFGFASSVAVDAQGNVFIGDSENTVAIKVAPVLATVSPIPTTISMAASSASISFGQTETFTATISVPSGATVPIAGSVTFYDGTTPLGQSGVSGGIATFTTSPLTAGPHTITASYGGSTDYMGSTSGIESTSTQSVVFASEQTIPVDVAVNAGGDVFMSDALNTQVIEIPPNGTQSVIISGVVTLGLAVNASGDLFAIELNDVMELQLTPTRTQTTIASGLSNPVGLAVDTEGDVFVCNTYNNQVLKITQAGDETTIGSGLNHPAAVAVNSSGDVFIAQSSPSEVIEVTPSGVQTTVFSGVGGEEIGGIAFNAQGDLFIVDNGNNGLLELTPTGTVSVFALGSNNNPDGLAIDSEGDVFIAETTGHRVVKITPGVPIMVSQSSPSLSWTKPADITHGTALGKNQLDATANVPGTFTYTPAAGTVLPVGQGEILSVTFTPTDLTDYSSVTTTTTINVVNPPTVIIGEQALFERKLKHGKPTGKPVLVGYMIDFSNKLSASSADLTANYIVDVINSKKVKKKQVTSLQPLTNFTVSYNDADDSVNIVFTNPPTFKTGGEIAILDGPINGVTDAFGSFVSGNRTLKISPGGQRIGLV